MKQRKLHSKKVITELKILFYGSEYTYKEFSFEEALITKSNLLS